MRIKTIMTACLAVPALSVLCLLSSCSSEELPTTEKPSTGPQTLKINLKPADTRAAAYTDPASSDPNPENKINRVTIGIFDKTTGNVKTIQDAPDPAAPSITTSQLVADDHILVAVNAPAGTFTGALTESDFEKKTLGIDDALAGGDGTATTVANANLPMFGAAKITQIGITPAYTADVAVSHMVAKVTLQSLNVNFDPNGAYQNATFTPSEVFMYSVPDKLDFDFYPTNTPTSYVYNYLTTSTPTYYNGEDPSAKKYLGTGSALDVSLSSKTLGTTSNWGTVGKKILFLYTMPNTSTKPTQIIIKGTFRPVGTDVGKETVYYPVNINYNSANGSAAEGATPKQVYPNKNYIVDVTIKGKGALLPSASLDPQIATANITVKSFVDASQTNVFN